MPILKRNSVIGIDFDNTLISYEQVFFNHALSLKLIGPHVNKNKKEVRDQIRLLEDGEIIWQKVQAFVYSQGIVQAHMHQGAGNFLKRCAQQGVEVYVVSHKTDFSQFDPNRINLRQAALKWMSANHFFEANGIGIRPDHVFFESTRLQKIERIQKLGCAHFVDDLEEVFSEKKFPKSVEKVLFAPQEQEGQYDDMNVFPNWEKIDEHFFS